MAIERVVQQGRSGNGTGSTGASWSSAVVQASDYGRLMIAVILHENIGVWGAWWRKDGGTSGEQALGVRHSVQLPNGFYLRVLALENAGASTSGSANIHLGGASGRFLGYTAYFRNTEGLRGSYVETSGTSPGGQTDPKRVTGLVSSTGDLVVAACGVIGIRNGTATAPMSDEGNYVQNGTGTDTSMDLGHLSGGADDEVAWTYGATHDWGMGVYVVEGIASSIGARVVTT